METGRSLVNVPVFGAGEAGAYAALMVSRKIGVLGITPDVPENMARILGDHLVTHTYPEGVSKTVDLLTPVGKENAIIVAKSLVEKGATCILFACTGFSTIGLKKELEHLAVPVIDLVQAQAIAYTLTK